MKFVNRYSSFILYLLAMLFIVLLHRMAGTPINLWILYGIPIGLATWNLGRSSGCWLAVIGVVLMVTTTLIWGHLFTSPVYLAIACISKAVAYFVLVGLVGALRKQEVERVYTPVNSRN